MILSTLPNLTSNGFGSLIKNTVTASFGRNEDNKAKDLLADLQGQGMAAKEPTLSS